MNKLLIIFVLCIFSFPAIAQETPVSALCQILKAHTPREDVIYVTGVDSAGNPIVSANLNQPLSKSYDVVEIPVEINLLDRFDLDVDGGIKLEPTVSNFRIFQDGRVMYGEQDISQQAFGTCGISGQVEGQVVEAAQPPPVVSPQVISSAPIVTRAPTASLSQPIISRQPARLRDDNIVVTTKRPATAAPQSILQHPLPDTAQPVPPVVSEPLSIPRKAAGLQIKPYPGLQPMDGDYAP